MRKELHKEEKTGEFGVQPLGLRQGIDDLAVQSYCER